MLKELTYAVSPTSIAELYKDFVDVFVLDERDRELRERDRSTPGRGSGPATTVMTSMEDKINLARELLEML